MNLDFTISKYPLVGSPFLGTIRAAIYDASNPTAEIDHQDFSAPHTTSRAISFSDVESVTYLVKIFAMPSTELLSWVQHPKAGQIEVKVPIFFRIGDGILNTPIAGTSIYTNTELIGWQYTVERRGVGTLVDDATKTYAEITKDDLAGEFELALDGDTFNPDETFAIHFLPKVSESIISSVTSGKWFIASKRITSDKTYDSTDFRNLLLLRPSSGTINYTLPAGSAFPVGYVIAFNSFGIIATYNIITDGTDSIEVGNANVSSIVLSQNQYLILTWDIITEKWHVVVNAGSGGSIAKSNNPDLNDANTLATTVATKILSDKIKYLGSGIFKPTQGSRSPGDVIGLNDSFTIVHNLNISGDYHIVGSIKKNGGGLGGRNLVAWNYSLCTANSFLVNLAEETSAVQDIEFFWQAYKL